MGLLTLKQFEEDDYRSWTAEYMSAGCFLCGKDLTFPHVYWAGHDSKIIGLHPRCAIDFAKLMLVDVLREK